MGIWVMDARYSYQNTAYPMFRFLFFPQTRKGRLFKLSGFLYVFLVLSWFVCALLLFLHVVESQQRYEERSANLPTHRFLDKNHLSTLPDKSTTSGGFTPYWML